MVFLELVEKAEDAQILCIELILNGEEAPVLGVKDEDEAEENGEKASVEMVVLALDGIVQVVPAVALGRGLEPVEKNRERFEHLLRELVGDVRLALSAFFEKARELLLIRDAEKACRREQHDEGVEDGAASNGAHVVDPEGNRSGGLAVGRIEQAKCSAVCEDSDRHAALSQKAVELRGRWVVPGTGFSFGLIEREAAWKLPNEGNVPGAGPGSRRVGRRIVRRRLCFERHRRANRLSSFRYIERQLFRECVTGIEEVGSQSENVSEETLKIGDGALGISIDVFLNRRCELQKPLLGRGRLARHALGFDEDGNRDDETLDGLDHAEPRLVESGFDIGHYLKAQRRGAEARRRGEKRSQLVVHHV